MVGVEWAISRSEHPQLFGYIVLAQACRNMKLHRTQVGVLVMKCLFTRSGFLRPYWQPHVMETPNQHVQRMGNGAKHIRHNF
jgi:hypothetical protein